MNKHALIALLCLCLLLGGCAAKQEEKTLYIAEQFGTAYAPVALMRVQGILEEKLPAGVKIEWAQLGNTAAIREAMLAGRVDVGFMAIPPFLIGKDAGMGWRICSGLSSVPMGLVTSDVRITTLQEIGSARIALPQPGSIQHILLAMAAEKELGQHDLFDNQLVTMSHPDGMSALLAGTEISLHFTTSPYLSQELAAGMHLVLSGEEAMGSPFTGIIAVARENFEEQEPEIYDAFLSALREAIRRINDDPAAAAQALAEEYDMEPEALLAEFTADGAGFSTEVNGLERFSEFLFRAGYTKEEYAPDALITSEVLLK